MNMINYLKNRIDDYYILQEYNNHLKSINKVNNKDLLFSDRSKQQSEQIKNMNPFYQTN